MESDLPEEAEIIKGDANDQDTTPRFLAGRRTGETDRQTAINRVDDGGHSLLPWMKINFIGSFNRNML